MQSSGGHPDSSSETDAYNVDMHLPALRAWLPLDQFLRKVAARRA